jgi:hypothetical protein
MKTITRLGAQGDVIFRRVKALPEGLKKQAKGPIVVAHSETGHHHTAEGAAAYYPTNDPLLAYLVAKGPVSIVHNRSWDTHETVELKGEGPEVVWEIRRQREHTPEGWRRVED